MKTDPLEVLVAKLNGKKEKISPRKQFRRNRKIRRVANKELFLRKLLMKVSSISSKLSK